MLKCFVCAIDPFLIRYINHVSNGLCQLWKLSSVTHFFFFTENGYYGCQHPFSSFELRMSISVSCFFSALRMSTSTLVVWTADVDIHFIFFSSITDVDIRFSGLNCECWHLLHVFLFFYFEYCPHPVQYFDICFIFFFMHIVSEI